jgi:hypothetical protein
MYSSAKVRDGYSETRGPFFTLPLGANFDPRCEFCPLDGGEVIPWGWKSLFAPPFPYIVESVHPCMGVNEGVNIPLREQISTLGARGEIKNGPLHTNLRSWVSSIHVCK